MTQADTAVREAAQAVIDRWDTPLWKNVEPTGEVIGRLRAALSLPAKAEDGWRERMEITPERLARAKAAYNADTGLGLGAGPVQIANHRLSAALHAFRDDVTGVASASGSPPPVLEEG